MLCGERVTLRPMRQEDVARQHAFNQDLELYSLDCSAPQVAPLDLVKQFVQGIGPAGKKFAVIQMRLSSRQAGCYSRTSTTVWVNFATQIVPSFQANERPARGSSRGTTAGRATADGTKALR